MQKFFVGLLFISFLFFSTSILSFPGKRIVEPVPDIFNIPLGKIINLQEYVSKKEQIFEKQNSPNNNWIAFITAEDFGFKNSSFSVLRADGMSLRKIVKESEYQFFSSPAWSPSGDKIALLSFFPYKILLYDLATNVVLEILSDLKNSESLKYFNPSIGYLGKSYLKWSSNSELEFENNTTDLLERYSININSGELKKTFKEILKSNESNFQETHFSQRNPLWKNEMLGLCQNQTIESAGCAVAAVAMNFKSLGINVNPQSLNNFLRKNNSQGYANECDIKWFVAVNFAPGVKFKSAHFNEFNTKVLDAQLLKGNPVIIGFNYVPETLLQHWVLVTGKTPDGKYIIKDPWETSSQNNKTLEDFGGKFDHLIIYEKD